MAAAVTGAGRTDVLTLAEATVPPTGDVLTRTDTALPPTGRRGHIHPLIPPHLHRGGSGRGGRGRSRGDTSYRDCQVLYFYIAPTLILLLPLWRV